MYIRHRFFFSKLIKENKKSTHFIIEVFLKSISKTLNKKIELLINMLLFFSSFFFPDEKIKKMIYEKEVSSVFFTFFRLHLN